MTAADRHMLNRIRAAKLQRKMERLLPAGEYSRMVSAVAAESVTIDAKVLEILLDRADRVAR